MTCEIAGDEMHYVQCCHLLSANKMIIVESLSKLLLIINFTFMRIKETSLRECMTGMIGTRTVVLIFHFKGTPA